MSDYFLGEIRIFSFDFAPRSWATCDGQLLPINQNQALFSLLGTTYGGNGQTTFALPDLRDRSPMHVGQSSRFGSTYFLGERSGEAAHTLSVGEMPMHTHTVNLVSGPGTSTTPAGNFLAVHRGGYADQYNTVLPTSTAAAGGGQAHENMPPFLTLNFCIALQGIFPTRN